MPAFILRKIIKATRLIFRDWNKIKSKINLLYFDLFFLSSHGFKKSKKIKFKTMKKHLLLLSSVLFAFSLSSQNDSRSNVIASSSENISQNNKVTKFKDKPESVGMCDTLNWPISSTWTGTNYYLTATPQFNDGWVNGVNVYADKEKAQYFDASSSPYALLHGFFFQVGKAYSQNPNKIVTFRIYDGTSGSPGALLAGST